MIHIFLLMLSTFYLKHNNEQDFVSVDKMLYLHSICYIDIVYT